MGSSLSVMRHCENFNCNSVNVTYSSARERTFLGDLQGSSGPLHIVRVFTLFMASEDTSLLSTEDNGPNRLDDVFLRFSSTRKSIILAMVSGYTMINYSLTELFTPSIPQIAKDLDSTGAVVNIAVSITLLASSLGALIVASYSTFYGRRPVYLYALPVFAIGSGGVAAAQSTPALFFWRFFQSMGASLGPVIGAAVIGDIFKLEERGRAMGISFATGLIGSTIGPFVGGYITHYYSWRVVHGILSLVGLIGFTTFYFLFPETSQPGARGIEKMNEAKGTGSSTSFIFINPLEPLWLLRSPSILLTGIIVSGSQMVIYVLMVSLPYTIGLRYHITNEAIVGACFLPVGIGGIIGSAIVGRVSDHTVIKWRRKRKGVWYPEDRLRAAVIPFAVLLPLSVLGFGLVNRLVDGNVGIMLSLVCLFFSGGGVNMTFAACTTYLVDVMQSRRSSEVLAAINLMYSLLAAMTVAVSLPMIDAYGVAVSSALLAALIWISYGGLYYIIKYGDQMRAWVDIGFSTALYLDNPESSM